MASADPLPNRHAAFDMLRILACLGVVAIHVYAPVINAFGSVPMRDWWEANIAFALSRWSVPAFVMMSGYWLLGPRTPSPVGGRLGGAREEHRASDAPTLTLPLQGRGFMKKRLLRVGVPLVFWSVLYLLVRRYEDGAILTWEQVGKDIFYGQPYYHLYFLFLMLGLYLLTPLFNRFIAWASPRQAFYAMFVLLGATMIYKWTEQFYPEYAPKANAFTYCLRFAPVYLLGYYIRFFPSFPRRRESCTATAKEDSRLRGNDGRRVMLCVVALAAIAPLLALFNYASFADWGRGSYFMAYLSPFVLLFAAIAVALAGQAAVSEKKWIRHLSDCTLGIYLLHPMIVDHWKGTPLFIEWMGAFTGSYMAVALLRKIRPLRLLIG